MRDKLEQKIEKEREFLDQEFKVSEELWGKIENRIYKPTFSLTYFRIVAAVITLLLIGFYSGYNWQEHKPEQIYSLGEILPEYFEVEKRYVSSIAELNQIVDWKSLENSELSWMLEELTILDKTNQEYLKELNRSPNNEIVVASLLDCYEKKIQLLRRIEREILREKVNKQRQS